MMGVYSKLRPASCSGSPAPLVCFDYGSRSEVFAGLYLKLLRGYALLATEQPVGKPPRRRDAGCLLAKLELAKRERRPAAGPGEEALTLGGLQLPRVVLANSSQLWEAPSGTLD